MKIKGKQIEKPSEEVIVFPRNGGDIIFKAKPVTNYEDFHKLCPRPEPDEIIRRGGARIKDVESPKYKKAIEDWATSKAHWMILKSLEATPDLEWESVDMSNSETWGNYVKELDDAGLLPMELAKLMEIIQNACGLNQDKIEKATADFLAMGEVQLENVVSLEDALSSIPSGDPVKSSD